MDISNLKLTVQELDQHKPSEIEQEDDGNEFQDLYAGDKKEKQDLFSE